MEKNKKENKKEGEDVKRPDPESVGPLTGKRYSRRAGDMHPQLESSSVWLVSFTDVMALMLTFFVLLFAMSEPEKQTWSDVISALQVEFNKFYGPLYNKGPQDAVNLEKINFSRALDINYMEALLESGIEKNEALKNITLIPQPGLLIVSLPYDLLFDSAEATVKESGRTALYSMGGTLRRIKNKIEVVGHADPRPVQGGEYDSNWELSLARAAHVAAILNNVGYERNIAIRGHSSGRFDDLDGVVEDDQRYDLSRRVDIIIMDHDGRKPPFVLAPDTP